MASNSSFDFLHVHGWQGNIVKVNMKTDNIATNPTTNNAYIRPSLNDSERDHGGTTSLSLIMSDVFNKDSISLISLTNISIPSIDFLSLEKFSLLIRKNNNKFDDTTNMMVNNNEQRNNSDDCLSTHNDYDKAWGISEDLQSEAKMQTTPTLKKRTTRDDHVGFYCLEAFSFSKDICSSERRNGQFLDGKKERNSEKRGRSKSEISYYVPYVLELKNNFSSPLDKSSKQILGSKPIHYGVKRIKSNFRENSTTKPFPKHTSCVALFHNTSYTVHDNRIDVVSSEYLSENYLCINFHTGDTYTTILEETNVLNLRLRDIERNEVTTKQRRINLSIQGPKSTKDSFCSKYDINRCKAAEDWGLKERKKKQFQAWKYFSGENSSVNILIHIYQYLPLILSLIVFEFVRLSSQIKPYIWYCLRIQIIIGIVIKLLYCHTKPISIHSISTVISLLHPATTNCSLFFLSPGKNKAETKDIANKTIFKYATIVSIGRLPVALLILVIQTIKTVLCNQLTCIWNALLRRQHEVFNSIKMPNIIVRKLSSISFRISSSYRSITSSSSYKVYFPSMYLHQKIAFDALVFWMFLLLPLLAVEGSRTWDSRNNELSTQLEYITKKYSKPELPEKEEIIPVQTDVFIQTKLCVKDDKRSHSILFKLTIVNVIAKGMNETVRYRDKITYTSLGPDHFTVPLLLEPLRSSLRKAKLSNEENQPIVNHLAFNSLHRILIENLPWISNCEFLYITTLHMGQDNRIRFHQENSIDKDNHKNHLVQRLEESVARCTINSMSIFNTATSQLSNFNSVHHGATKHIEQSHSSGYEQTQQGHGDNQYPHTYHEQCKSHLVSWMDFFPSFKKILDTSEVVITTFLVPINMFHNDGKYTWNQMSLGSDEKWIICFVILLSFSLFA